MSETPILSICIPAYNRPLWFRRALTSIVVGNEPYASSIEIIVTRARTLARVSARDGFVGDAIGHRVDLSAAVVVNAIGF